MKNFGFNDYELVYLARNHNEKALKLLFEKYIDVFEYHLYRYKVGWKDYDYLKSDGMQLIYYCIQVYNKDVPFYAFYKLCAVRLILKYFRKRKLYEINYDNFATQDFLQEEVSTPEIHVVYNNKLQEIICQGLMDGKKLKEIASELNLNPKKVYYEFEKLKKENNK